MTINLTITSWAIVGFPIMNLTMVIISIIKLAIFTEHIIILP
jgi:hypothetical protein